MICRSQKPADRREQILFIDAVAEVARQRAQSFLRPEHQARILSAYQAFKDDPGFAAVVKVGDVLAVEANLSIARYVKRPKAEFAGGEATVAATWATFEEKGREFWLGMDVLVDLLDGLTPAEDADA